MRAEEKNAHEKKLRVKKQTIKNLTVKTGVRAGVWRKQISSL
jgi:hypothetical protein